MEISELDSKTCNRMLEIDQSASSPGVTGHRYKLPPIPRYSTSADAIATPGVSR